MFPRLQVRRAARNAGENRGEVFPQMHHTAFFELKQLGAEVPRVLHGQIPRHPSCGYPSDAEQRQPAISKE